jgi:hypothetical protein
LFLGAWTLLPACQIGAHGTAGWGPVGWAAVWLFGLVVCVPMMRYAAVDFSGGTWWRRGGAGEEYPAEGAAGFLSGLQASRTIRRRCSSTPYEG